MLEFVEILGVRVHRVTADEAVRRARKYIHSDGQHWIATINPEFVMAAQENKEFRSALRVADMSVPDGIGLVLLGKLKRWGLRERVTGADLTTRLLSLAEREGIPVFFFGGEGRVPAELGAQVALQFPKLHVVGCENEFNEDGSMRSDEEQLKRIRDAVPKMLFVALGAPKQEIWIRNNLHSIPSVKLAMGVGGTFDFMAGKVARAPRTFQRLGIEWLWRLLIEPRRWKRIITATVIFPLAVLRNKS